MVSRAAWLLLFDEARARVASRLMRWQRAVDARAVQGWSRTTCTPRASCRHAANRAGRLLCRVHRYRLWLLGAAVLIACKVAAFGEAAAMEARCCLTRT
ncbi:hypothetical protein GCM10028795_08990 [Lysobacter olei]